MPNTTNFNFPTPADTDLVKDGASAIRSLGNSIDTAFVDLKGGTTGQILSKASNTDLDYTWITNDVGDITEVAAGTGISGGGTSGSVTITNSMATAIDAKGDLVAGTGADAFARLAVGANNTVLTADSSTATGLKWATPSSGAYTLLNSGGTTFSGSSISVASIPSTYTDLLVVIEAVTLSATGYIRMVLNSLTDYTSTYINAPAVTTVGGTDGSGDVRLTANRVVATTSQAAITIKISNYANATSYKPFFWFGTYQDNTAALPNAVMGGGSTKSSNAINEVKITTSGTFSGGKLYVYGVK